MAVILGLIAADLVYLVWTPNEAPPHRSAPAVEYKDGQDLDVAITLVSTDARALACAGSELVNGRHCEFESKTQKWQKPVDKAVPQPLLAPYKTTDDVMFLVGGLFNEPALQERLKIDPPTFGGEHLRFVAHCKLHLDGKMSSFDVRWAPAGPWYPATNVWIGTASGCTLSDP